MRTGRQRGEALLEMALMLPILLMVLIGSIQIGLALYERSFVQYAAASGAQYLAVGNPPGQVSNYVKGLASGMGISADQLTVGFSHAPGDLSSCPPQAPPISAWCAAVSIPYTFVIPFMPSQRITLAATAEAPLAGTK